MKYTALLLLMALVGCSTKYPGETSKYENFPMDGVEVRVADSPWIADGNGNHRAIVEIDKAASAVEVDLKWRRPDLRPETKKVVVRDQQGDEVENVIVKSLSSEEGKVIFQPTAGEGVYYIYYLPYKFRKGWDDARYGKPWNDYLPPVYAADNNWLETVNTISELPKGKVIAYESRTDFDYFTSMGVIATKAEEDSIKKVNSSNPIVFLEDRAYPIKLRKNLPYKWVQNASHDSFSGQASPNEYYVWQVGIWAAHAPVSQVKLVFSDLISGSAVINKDQITCFNQEGVNWDGKQMTFKVNVPVGEVQPLWCGVQIPENAKKGVYKGTITITAEGVAPQTVNIAIDVTGKPLADKGDGDLWRHARLRWLNSQIGVDSLPTKAYQPIKVIGDDIVVANKTVKLQKNGMVGTVTYNGNSLYDVPALVRIQTSTGNIDFVAEDLKITQPADGLVEWLASSSQSGINIICKAYVEYDGYMRYNISLSSEKPLVVKDIQLVNSYSKDASTYCMGIGYSGGLTPAKYSWDWKGPYDSYWMGSDKIGAHVEFRGGAYHGPLINDYKPAPPVVWSNHGKGRITIDKSSASTTKVIASTGEIALGETAINLEFDVLLTPVKPLDSKKHFSERYFHNAPNLFNDAMTEGANIANIHHARNLNPVINYPFIVQDSLIQFVKEVHAKEGKVKLYYTVRELTNYTTEIHALMSLGNEIFMEGPGYGTPWHTEHLIDGYKAAWYTELPGENADAALVLTSFSRWINYYLEGLRWMFENYKIDGIYMDDVSFDRNVMKRMRKIMDTYRPDALIDLHSNTWYSVGPMNQYTDFFPYIDRLWFGESFQYNKMDPNEWFVTFSGIPFGMMSEMLQDGGNQYLGMLYGTTNRHSYIDSYPAPVWEVWNKFGIEEAAMYGYWNASTPVKTNNEKVKATSYVREGKTLISLGNFSDTKERVKLYFDWKALGLDQSKVKIYTDNVKDFQVEAIYGIDTEYLINPKEGLLLIVEE